MGSSDLSLRQKAIPFQGQIFNYNSNEQSSQRVSQAWDLGDIAKLATRVSSNTIRYFPIRLLKPFYGAISQAYFTLDLHTSGTGTEGTGSAPIRLYIGGTRFLNKYQTENDSAAQVTLIKKHHAQIFGSADPLTTANGTRLLIEAADIMPLITYDETNPIYSPEFFGIGLYFEDPPSMVDPWDVLKFKVDLAVNVGL